MCSTTSSYACYSKGNLDTDAERIPCEMTECWDTEEPQPTLHWKAVQKFQCCGYSPGSLRGRNRTLLWAFRESVTLLTLETLFKRGSQPGLVPCTPLNLAPGRQASQVYRQRNPVLEQQQQKGSHESQAGLRLSVQPRRMLSLWLSCLYCPRSGILGVSHHTYPMRCWGSDMGFVRAC